jgi:SpoIID/LytB domain protein
VKDGSGETHTLAAGTVALSAALKLPVDGAKAAKALSPPLTFAPGQGGPLTLGRPYRGQVEVDVVDGRLRAIDVVGLEQYLYGVVPAEMPSGWAPEALKAQAIAARSYALATRKVGAPFDVYPDTRSQVYLGSSHEQPASTAAVDATKGQVVTYAGKVATTYFFSTSGGQTESSLDWTGVDLPYLVSVPDPYDALSPYHDWGPVPVTGQTVAKALNLSGKVTDLRPAPNAAGRVGSVGVVTRAKTGEVTATVTGTRVRGALALRSTWFAVGVLSLLPPAPAAPVPYGSAVKLSGVARGLSGVALEQRTLVSSWHSTGTVAPGAHGAVQLTEKPTITTDYRLASATAAAAYVRVRVTPRVRIVSAAAGQVQGTEAPALPGARVRIEREAPDLSWAAVASGTVDAAGHFAVRVPAVPGAVYRAVVTPGHGYWRGVSPPVTAAG